MRTTYPKTHISASRTRMVCSRVNEYFLRENENSITSPANASTSSSSFLAIPVRFPKLPLKSRTHDTKPLHALPSTIPSSESAACASSRSVTCAKEGSRPHIAVGSPHADADGIATTRSCQNLTNSRYDSAKLLTLARFMANENASENAFLSDASVRRRIENETAARFDAAS